MYKFFFSVFCKVLSCLEFFQSTITTILYTSLFHFLYSLLDQWLFNPLETFFHHLSQSELVVFNILIQIRHTVYLGNNIWLSILITPLYYGICSSSSYQGPFYLNCLCFLIPSVPPVVRLVMPQIWYLPKIFPYTLWLNQCVQHVI